MPHRRPATPLYCKAPHPDPAKRYACCNSLLGYFPEFIYEFQSTHEHAPVLPDLVNVGVIWVRCPRSSCGKWNAFRIAPPPEPMENDDGDSTGH